MLAPHKLRTINLLVPDSVRYLDLWPNERGFVEWFVLPAVPELEPNLMQILNSPGSVLVAAHGQQDEVWMRADCVRALGSFKSPENVALLKGLLTDTGVGYAGLSNESDHSPYGVRLAAYHALVSWGVQVPKPGQDP